MMYTQLLVTQHLHDVTQQQRWCVLVCQVCLCDDQTVVSVISGL